MNCTYCVQIEKSQNILIPSYRSLSLTLLWTLFLKATSKQPRNIEQYVNNRCHAPPPCHPSSMCKISGIIGTVSCCKYFSVPMSNHWGHHAKSLIHRFPQNYTLEHKRGKKMDGGDYWEAITCLELLESDHLFGTTGKWSSGWDYWEVVTWLGLLGSGHLSCKNK